MALTDKLTAIADAIRAKTGKSGTLTLDQMPGEISSITGGGGGSSAGCVTVTFMNGSTELFSRPVYIGDDCPDPVAQGRITAPTKESTAQYHYTYYGWGASDGGAADANILKNITGDKTVYAIYTSAVRSYTITYLDDDGSTLKTETLNYGAMPSYVPVKDGYVHEGWEPAATSVTGNATYVAKWKAFAATGTVGSNVYWSLDNTGLLRLYGSGSTSSYAGYYTAGSGSPKYPAYYSYRDEITAIVVEEGITTLGNEVLAGMRQAVSISLPSTVTSLGKYAFAGCSQLSSITLPSSVGNIQEGAFRGCRSLTEFTFPENAWSPSRYCFLYCSGLVSINFLNKPTSFDDSAFSGCTALSSITIPGTVAKIGKNAFSDCGQLISATFEEPTGWWVSTSSSATSGTSVTVSNPTTAANYLKNTYVTYYWKRS